MTSQLLVDLVCSVQAYSIWMSRYNIFPEFIKYVISFRMSLSVCTVREYMNKYELIQHKDCVVSLQRSKILLCDMKMNSYG